MHEIIFHLIGDYILQTEQMAVRKLRSWFWAIVHANVYSLPFLLVIQRWECWAVIAGTHAVIDRMAIASTICRIKNLIWFGPDAPEKEQNTGYGIETPPFVRFWLVVIVDNTIHLSINHIAEGSEQRGDVAQLQARGIEGDCGFLPREVYLRLTNAGF